MSTPMTLSGLYRAAGRLLDAYDLTGHPQLLDAAEAHTAAAEAHLRTCPHHTREVPDACPI